MLQSEKKLKARHREKNYFKRPRSTQDLIPVDTVYPDGMFLSNGNIYSKSYRFSDINYQIAGQAEKESIIREMRALAKGCTPGEMSQITIVNQHINRELLERLQYAEQGDGLDELRGEMNEILENQAGRGTGIIQERYFTVSVGKSTPREATIHFDRVGTELALGFANMGSKLTPIGLSDRLRILHDFYRPGDENYWHFDFEDKQRKKHSFKDSIAPMSFLPAPDYFKIGSRYVRVLAMTEYASWVYDDTVKELINLDTEMILSVNFLPVPTEESVKYYTKKLDSLEANSMRFQQKQLQRMQIAPPEPYSFRKDRDSITDSLNDIIQKDLGLVVATVTLAHMADSLEQLDSDTELNYALMKISAWQKAQGDTVEWWEPLGLFDRVYSSKVFDFTPENPYLPSDTIKGGTGYGLFTELDPEIDEMFPDYSIYPACDYAIGYLTRGCPNRCRWCIVPKKEGNIRPYRAWQDLVRPDTDKLVLMDNNILACDYGVEQLAGLIGSGYRIDLNQGMDARLVTPEVADILARLKWINYLRFSCDRESQIEPILRACELLKVRGVKPYRVFVYLLVTADLGSASRRVEALKGLRGINLYAQAERNEGLGIRPSKAQLEFTHRYVYSGCFRRETWEEYIKRKGLIF